MSFGNRRTMIITGGTGNNGLAIARMALERGMNVAFLCDKQAAAKLDAQYRDQVMDAAPEPNTSQEEALRRISARFGGIDVVVNGSVDHIRRNFDQTDRAFWRRSMEAVEAAFFNTKLAMPYLLKSAAPRVIHLTTCDGRASGYFDNPAVAAAQGGLIALTREMARELGPKGITVNCVAIGHLAEDTLSDEERAEIIAATPLKRMGIPADIAGAVNFLASEEASFITGAVIDVNGGILMGS